MTPYKRPRRNAQQDFEALHISTVLTGESMCVRQPRKIVCEKQPRGIVETPVCYTNTPTVYSNINTTNLRIFIIYFRLGLSYSVDFAAPIRGIQ